jgi:AbrB family looped-hinge helix DNA binding protein
MSYTATSTGKGQVTIPIGVHKRLGLSEGDRIEFLTADGETVIGPARRHDNPFVKYRGVLDRKLPATVKEIVREERETRGR